MKYSTFVTLAVLSVWTRAEITNDDFRQLEDFQKKCQITCPLKEDSDSVCAVDLMTFRFKQFINKCFYWAQNKCNGRQYVAMKSPKWCNRWRQFHLNQIVIGGM